MRHAARFNVTPAAFWRLSMREWRALTAPLLSEHLDRSAFDALAARFPDDHP
jgi:uncharacterized phage protein (TIGR02216 family)